jgi:hypothetical protein
MVKPSKLDQMMLAYRSSQNRLYKVIQVSINSEEVQRERLL